MKLLWHLFEYAEVYVVFLAWILIPLGYFAVYLFFHKHYGMFTPTSVENLEKENTHGATG